MDAKRRRILAAALDARFGEVASRPSVQADASSPPTPPPPPPEEAEEALRRLMVILIPRLKSGAADRADIAAIMELLARIESRARLDDLRFLDPFHRVYELAGRSPGGGALPEAFFRRYRRCLRRVLEELA